MSFGNSFRCTDENPMADTAAKYALSSLADGQVISPRDRSECHETWCGWHSPAEVRGSGSGLSSSSCSGAIWRVPASRTGLYSIGTRSQSSSWRRLASTSVLPMTVASPGKITIQISGTTARQRRQRPEIARLGSAIFNGLGEGEHRLRLCRGQIASIAGSPAWTVFGRPWGERGTFNGPSAE